MLTGKGNLITSLYKRREILQIKRLHRLVKYSTRHAFVGVVYSAGSIGFRSPIPCGHSS